MSFHPKIEQALLNILGTRQTERRKKNLATNKNTLALND